MRRCLCLLHNIEWLISIETNWISTLLGNFLASFATASCHINKHTCSCPWFSTKHYGVLHWVWLCMWNILCKMKSCCVFGELFRQLNLVKCVYLRWSTSRAALTSALYRVVWAALEAWGKTRCLHWVTDPQLSASGWILMHMCKCTTCR